LSLCSLWPASIFPYLSQISPTATPPIPALLPIQKSQCAQPYRPFPPSRVTNCFSVLETKGFPGTWDFKTRYVLGKAPFLNPVSLFLPKSSQSSYSNVTHWKDRPSLFSSIELKFVPLKNPVIYRIEASFLPYTVSTWESPFSFLYLRLLFYTLGFGWTPSSLRIRLF
jgi:hypothetical protein